MAEDSPLALEAGLRALSRRDLSRAELIARLERCGIERQDAERVSEQLAAAGYQSDDRTAEERARVLATRLQGDLAIRVDLERRGLEEDCIDSALAGIEPELARAERLARRTGDASRLIRALHRKGYTEETIEAALRVAGAQG